MAEEPLSSSSASRPSLQRIAYVLLRYWALILFFDSAVSLTHWNAKSLTFLRGLLIRVAIQAIAGVILLYYATPISAFLMKPTEWVGDVQKEPDQLEIGNVPLAQIATLYLKVQGIMFYFWVVYDLTYVPWTAMTGAEPLAQEHFRYVAAMLLRILMYCVMGYVCLFSPARLAEFILKQPKQEI